MKKLTKNFIKKEMKHFTFKDERIVDIEIYNNGMSARIITITSYHLPQIYLMEFNGQKVVTYHNILDFDSKETFNKPISITTV